MSLKEHALVTWDNNGNIELHEVVHPLNMFKWYVREGEYTRVMAVCSNFGCNYENGRLVSTGLESVQILRNWTRETA